MELSTENVKVRISSAFVTEYEVPPCSAVYPRYVRHPLTDCRRCLLALMLGHTRLALIPVLPLRYDLCYRPANTNDENEFFPIVAHFVKKSLLAGDIVLDVAAMEQAMANWFTAQQISSLLDEHLAALELFAAQWTSAPEDCVQEAILELMRQPQSPRNIAAWLFYVVKCRAIIANRSDTRRRRHEGLAGRLVRVANDPQNVPFDAEELANALRQLDGQEREIVIARIWGGLGFIDLGEMLGISTATAFRRFESGLKVLRAKLEISCETTNPSKPINRPNFPTN